MINIWQSVCSVKIELVSSLWKCSSKLSYSTYLRVVITINLLQLDNEFSRRLGEVFKTLESKRKTSKYKLYSRKI